MFAFLSRKASPDVLERLADVESQLRAFRRDVSDLESLIKRVRDRQSHDKVPEITELPEQEGGEAETGATGPAVHALLTPKQRLIQQQILQRRAGG